MISIDEIHLGKVWAGSVNEITEGYLIVNGEAFWDVIWQDKPIFTMLTFDEAHEVLWKHLKSVEEGKA